MTFTKSNINFAKKRGIDLIIDTEYNNVMFFVNGVDEPFLIYLLNDEGTVLTYRGQVYGNKIEDLPAHITSSKQLNNVIDYLAITELEAIKNFYN